VEPKPLPKPVVAEMKAPTPPDEPKPITKPANDSSRFVTVSHPAPKKVNKDMPRAATLLDIAALDDTTSSASGTAKGVRLDEVDRAIIQAFMREWVAPDASKLSLDQRTVSLDVRIGRDGTVLNFTLPRRSGSDDLDLSVLEAADRLGKIETKLPASYRRDVYEFQVNFHVE
jgi:outer membrane biosynthesis protein TonB